MRQMNLQPHQVISKHSMPEPNTGCWLWVAQINDRGYGCLTYGKKKYKAHRFSYQWLVGDVPKNILVCHKCDTPSCVNPDHLFLGTTQDNINDKVKKKRHNYGSKVPQGKLDKVSVMIIREVWSLFGRGSQLHIARYFGVCQQSVSNIVTSKVWNSVPNYNVK